MTVFNKDTDLSPDEFAKEIAEYVLKEVPDICKRSGTKTVVLVLGFAYCESVDQTADRTMLNLANTRLFAFTGFKGWDKGIIQHLLEQTAEFVADEAYEHELP